jgi:hypothetical protein
MNGKLWADMFFESLDSLSGKEKVYTDEAWTKFLGKVICDVGEKTDCYVAMRREEVGDDECSGEYFDIDALFIDNKEYENENNNWDPFVLPSAAIELENNPRHDKIAYCMWKILCIRTQLRVLICYQGSSNKISDLISCLTQVISKGNLLEGNNNNDGELLVLVGDDSLPEETEWIDYYSIYEWEGNRLIHKNA